MRHLEEFLNFKEAEGLSPRTIKWYRDKLEEFARATGAEELEVADVSWFLVQKRATCNATSLHMYWRVITTFARWLYLQTYLPTNVVARIPKPRYKYEQKQGFSPDEVRAMLAAETYRPLFTRALVLVLYDTGIRAGEICALRRHQIDATGFQLTVRGKTAERVVPIGREALRALQRYQSRERRAPPREDHVFVTRHGAPITPDYLAQKVRRMARAAGIERHYVGPHAFRHGFALQYLKNGGDVLHLRQVLGHTTTQMTERYVRLLPQDLHEVHSRLSPVASL